MAVFRFVTSLFDFRTSSNEDGVSGSNETSSPALRVNSSNNLNLDHENERKKSRDIKRVS